MSDTALKRIHLAQMIIHETEVRFNLVSGTLKSRKQTERVKAARRSALNRIAEDIGIGRDHATRFNPVNNALTYQQVGKLFNRHHSTIMFLLGRLKKPYHRARKAEQPTLELAS